MARVVGTVATRAGDSKPNDTRLPVADEKINKAASKRDSEEDYGTRRADGTRTSDMTMSLS
jgi:hypothetical protein